MTTTLTRRLSELAAAINLEHERCYRTALGHAIRVGELLLEAKAQVSHGEWGAWLKEHVVFDERTARGYMQLASLPEANRRPVADLGIRDALRSIAKPAELKAPAPDLRTAFGQVDRAELDAAAAELDALPEQSRFPVSAMERTTWRQINHTLERVRRFMDDASRDGLSGWSRREALNEAARHARSAAEQLSELADTLA